MWKSLSAFAFAFALSQSASAVLIDNGLYLTDTSSGLDWLKLTETIGRSYNDISSNFSAGGEFTGWQYASGAQFESLLLDQGIAADMGCSSGVNFCGGANPSNYPIIDSLVNTIGDTFELATSGVETSKADASLGILNDSGGDGASHYVGLLVGSNLSDTPYASTHYGDPQGDGISQGQIGSFLVRLSVVPVPASGYLFISATLALLSRKRFLK